ncbi:hypothetical protein PPERSA_07575 [Pseudocohnilembus persalinus]|uniref:Uncharacterized protein n=1 Tax=Pseudocohnilembus persalinus TaxID=266149 RepID=A0A0V0R008_PSEPJ|nr:hypothetical protein PPERSA_07575 [Pseudocohnilembus persalinus]|eukprot:KRX07825.1 hypothetical protein PPERSA_07575 [Pseudocohnilembus persalinus]
MQNLGQMRQKQQINEQQSNEISQLSQKNNENLIKSQNHKNIPDFIDEILMYRSCKGAIKFNENLQLFQVQKLLENIEICEFPLYCVHGRKSMNILLDFGQIAEKSRKEQNKKLLL